MQECDRAAIVKRSVPGLLLMENAGRGIVEAIERRYGSPAGRSFLIVCGKGNNGGDGFVVARRLLLKGARVTVALTGNPSQLSADALVNYKILKAILREKSMGSVLRVIPARSLKKSAVLQGAEFAVDAIFGTGFKGEVREPYKEVIEWMNGARATRISIDIPSGMNADNGEVSNVAVKADMTVTMGFRKIGLIINKGMTYAGEVKVVDIGIPLHDNRRKDERTFLVEQHDVSRLLPRRPVDAHKHSVGKIFVLAGSRGFTGAAAMASSAAMRAGAGAAVLGTPSSVYPILAKKLTEVMVEPLPETEAGSVSAKAFDQVKKHLAWSDLAIIGPGLSRNPETRDLVYRIVAECDTPMLIDADGLNLLSERISVVKKHRSPNVVITPHSGELARLLGTTSGAVDADRVEVARRTARQFGVTVVLKGAPTVTASEDGCAFINSTGNAGMATAGSGDILAGLIAGLWAQGMERTEAAFCGVYIHGGAGDLAKARYGEKSLMATDIGEHIPPMILSLEAAARP